jgi:hypothetical protein
VTARPLRQGVAPRDQWTPVALSLGAYGVTRAGAGPALAAQAAEAAGLARAGELPEGQAPLPRALPLAELAARVRAAKGAAP